ncbi:MAG: glycosyltransferase [Candidatus Margulisbacteria bacterium]|nr:glycosyltransferase [Candidatus Margulisiibacteriota bacterium]
MKLSICMIVKNEEQVLARTLPNLSKYADEIILLDTGSTDKTVEVAQKFGARVYSFVWSNDFSAARNESLKHSTGDWILWIDADEYLKEEDLAALKAAISDTAENAFRLTIYESKYEQCEQTTGYLREKLFRNGLGYHFERAINEQLYDGAGKLVSGQAIPVAIYHWGKHLAENRMNEKRERYVRLYSAWLEKNPDDPFVHFLLANVYEELGRLEDALSYHDRAYQLAPTKVIGRQALEKKANLLLRAKRLPEAAKAAEALLQIDPQNIPARNVFASIYLVMGKIDNAIEILTAVIGTRIQGEVENIYQTKAWPHFLLSKAYELKGDAEKARENFEQFQSITGVN